MKPLWVPLANPLFGGWGTVIVCVSVYLCTVPMTNVLGFEYCFIMGVLLSLASGHLAATAPIRLRGNRPGGEAIGTTKLLLFAALPAGILLLATLLISLFNQLFVAPCNNIQGLLFFILLPVISVVLAVVTGVFAGGWCGKKRCAVAIWTLFWIAALTVSVFEVYHSPVVFSFNPFFGYWPGVWYDREISVTTALLTYRGFNLVIGGVLVLSLFSFLDPERLQLKLKKPSAPSAALILAGICVAGLLLASGESLGHRMSTIGLKQRLPAHIHSDGIDLYFSTEISMKKQRAIARDAQFSLDQLKAFFGIDAHPSVTVFVFHSAQQKKSLMGARHTSVAKPWLGQTYVIADEVPHWTLRHELAHLVAAQFATGPFRVGGYFHGLIPIPALVEGLAVAATPSRHALSVHQTARALDRLNLLPAVQQLMGPGFLKLYAGNAYTAAGSFIRYIRDTFGPSAIRRMYAGENISEVTGHTLSTLETMWHQYLNAIQIPDSELEWVRYRLDRPAIVETRCVREIARIQKIAAEYLTTPQWPGGLRLLQEAHRRSGESTETDIELFFSEAGCMSDHTIQHGNDILKKAPGQIRQLQISEALVDFQIDSLSLAELAAAYGRLAESPNAHDVLRRLAVKRHLCNYHTPETRTLLRFFSTVIAHRRPPEAAAIHALMVLRNRFRDDPLLPYLVGRILFQEDQQYASATELKQAFHLDFANKYPEFATPGRLTLGQAYLNLRQFGSARRQFQFVVRENDSMLGYRDMAEEWIRRVNWTEQKKP